MRASGIIAIAALWTAPSSVFGQGCAMCYTTAAAAGKHAARSLDLGILVLLIPTLLMFLAVLAFAIRRANPLTRTESIERLPFPEIPLGSTSGSAAELTVAASSSEAFTAQGRPERPRRI